VTHQLKIDELSIKSFAVLNESKFLLKIATLLNYLSNKLPLSKRGLSLPNYSESDLIEIFNTTGDRCHLCGIALYFSKYGARALGEGSDESF
jgi:hypothetical protein